MEPSAFPSTYLFSIRAAVRIRLLRALSYIEDTAFVALEFPFEDTFIAMSELYPLF
jgi:hypothetical protein